MTLNTPSKVKRSSRKVRSGTIFSRIGLKRLSSHSNRTAFNAAALLALPGNFIKGIVQDIFRSSVVIADLTGNRPNVYYELGIRHALQTGTLIITQDVDSIPSDLRSYYCFQYSYSKEHYRYEKLYKDFEDELHQKMAHFFDNLFPSDNPVSDFIGYKNAFLEERFNMEKQELIFLTTMARDLVKTNFALCEEFVRMGKHITEKGEKTFTLRKQ